MPEEGDQRQAGEQMYISQLMGIWIYVQKIDR